MTSPAAEADPATPTHSPDTPGSPRVTVCVPVYNEADVIGRTIECLKRQTFTNFVAYISDNCSTDGTPEAVEKATAGDHRFRLFRQAENIGAMRNFRFLGGKVSTEYLMFLGSHDTISDACLEDLVGKLSANCQLIGVIPFIRNDGEAGIEDHPQIDTTYVNEPVVRFLLYLLRNDFAVHGLYRTRSIRTSLARLHNNLGGGVLYLCELALRGRFGTSNSSWYHFHKRVSIISREARFERANKLLMVENSRFSGARLIWKFFKLAFVSDISGKRPWLARVSLIFIFPVVIFRFRRLLVRDLGVGKGMS